MMKIIEKAILTCVIFAISGFFSIPIIIYATDSEFEDTSFSIMLADNCVIDQLVSDWLTIYS